MGEVSSRIRSRTKGDMKVLFFIFVSAGGKGGHFHSLNQISLEIAKSNPSIRIITFGREESPILNDNPCFYKHLYFSKSNFINFYLTLKDEIKSFNADVLHFFDAHSFNIFFPLSFSSKRKIVVNKCGGPNPNAYPIVPNLILFSEENKKWFLTNKLYNNSNIKVIPNRSVVVKTREQQEYSKNSKSFNIVRICRIGSTYYGSILNGINLIKELSKRNINTKFYVIGKVVDESIYKQLVDHSIGFNIEFITEEKFTTEASKMLYLADAVLGTGRSAMEACSLGLPTLMPSKHYDFPVILNKDNFDKYFEKNFTDRVGSEVLEQETILQEIIKLIENKENYKELSAFSKEVFNKYFDVSQAGKNYLKFYKELNHQKIHFSMLLTNFKRSLSTMRRMFKGHF